MFVYVKTIRWFLFVLYSEKKMLGFKHQSKGVCFYSETGSEDTAATHLVDLRDESEKLMADSSEKEQVVVDAPKVPVSNYSNKSIDATKV